MTTTSPLIDSIEHAQCNACSSFVHKIFKCILLNISGQILLFIASKVFLGLQHFFSKSVNTNRAIHCLQTAVTLTINTNLNTIYLFISFGIIVEGSVYTVQ